MTRHLVISVLCAGLAGCASTPAAVLVTGNRSCQPSQALPTHLAVKPAPETVTAWADFWTWLVDDRRAYGEAVRDYNTLHDECVKP